jgi:carboxypeptidase C (cathepsin A)
MSSPPRRGAWLGALVSTCLTFAAFAQDTAVSNPAAVAAARGADRPTTARPEPEGAERRLPADVTTRHVLELPDRTLRFAATAAGIRLADPQGQPQADIAVIDYQLQTDQPANQRPVTFVVNGGPGASSAWLHLGALGPWRLPMAGDAALPSAPPQVLPNAETWLDLTDLVFVDPVGTGYSGFAREGEELRRRLWSVEGDIQSLAEVIRRWLEKTGRVGSPKFLVGESYGGFRGPRLARALQADQGIGLLGLMLISPVLDFAGRGSPFDPLAQATRLPSMAAAARAASGAAVSRESLAEVERYALGEYLVDLLRGERDTDAVARLSERVAALTGLDPALVRQRRGRLETGEFLRELHRGSQRVGSAYDATETRPDPFPAALVSRHPDPVLDGLMAPLTSAMLELYGKRLDWRPEGRRYELLNRNVSREWGWGGALNPPEAIGSLRTALAFDTRLRVVVAHGLFDLVTPYSATRVILDQLPATASGDRVRFLTYPGGHMFYALDGSRMALLEEARWLLEGR